MSQENHCAFRYTAKKKGNQCVKTKNTEQITKELNKKN